MRLPYAMLTTHSIAHMSSSWRGHIALFAAIASGSAAAIFVRFAQHEGVPSPVIAAYRLALGALILTPYILQRYRTELRQMNRREVIFSALAGFWLAVHLTAINLSLEHTSILVCSVLLGTGPLWIALLEVYLLKVHLSSVVWIGLIVALLGVVVIAFSGASGDLALGHNPLLGAALASVGAVLSAAYAITGRKVRAQVAVLPYIWLVFTCAAITSLLIVFFSHESLFGYSFDAYIWLILLTLLPQLLGHGAWNYALGHLTATYISVFSQLGVVITSMFALMIFHEIPQLLQLPGSLAIVVGVTLVTLGQSRPE
jgi:drug/metabolite transporter (DMT)-like permease